MSIDHGSSGNDPHHGQQPEAVGCSSQDGSHSDGAPDGPERTGLACQAGEISQTKPALHPYRPKNMEVSHWRRGSGRRRRLWMCDSGGYPTALQDHILGVPPLPHLFCPVGRPSAAPGHRRTPS